MASLRIAFAAAAGAGTSPGSGSKARDLMLKGRFKAWAQLDYRALKGTGKQVSKRP